MLGGAIARRIGARARSRGEIGSDALERFPMLLLAPGLMVTMWNHLFKEDSLKPADVIRGYLELLFGDAI